MKRFYTLCVVLLVLSSLLLSAYAQENGVGNQTPDPATWMPDANLRNAVRAALHLNANQPLTQQKLLNLTVLNAPRLGITDLTGLEYATNLRTLSVGGNQIHDLTPLGEPDEPNRLIYWGQSHRRYQSPRTSNEPQTIGNASEPDY